uniref:Uncharacterized protein n=1 Tax=Micrurus lemniscatus lemniscatus TaxID=129467 RepID=A0A2D4JQN4_MICLE
MHACACMPENRRPAGRCVHAYFQAIFGAIFRPFFMPKSAWKTACFFGRFQAVFQAIFCTKTARKMAVFLAFSDHFLGCFSMLWCPRRSAGWCPCACQKPEKQLAMVHVPTEDPLCHLWHACHKFTITAIDVLKYTMFRVV